MHIYHIYIYVCVYIYIFPYIMGYGWQWRHMAPVVPNLFRDTTGEVFGVHWGRSPISNE